MEDKVIGFGKGIHREPSIGAVGELSDCVNLYSEGEEMKMMPRMTAVSGVPQFTNGSVLAKYIHKPNDEQHLIMLAYGNVTTVKEWTEVTDWKTLAAGDEIKWSNIGLEEYAVSKITSIQPLVDDTSVYHIIINSGGNRKFAFHLYSNDPNVVVLKEVSTELEYNAIAWSNMDSESDNIPHEIFQLADGETLNEISSMGNVLLVSTSVKMYYFLWANGCYTDYSLDSIGDLDMQFTLKGEYKVSSTDGINIVNIAGSTSTSTEYDELIATWTHDGYYQYDSTNSVVSIINESGKIEKGTYLVKAIDGNENFDYMVCGIKSGYKPSDITVHTSAAGGGGKDADINAATGNLLNSANFYVNDTTKFDVLCHATCNNDSKIYVNGEYDYVIALITSTCYRNFTLKFYKQNDTSLNYKYAVNKEGSDNINTLLGSINKYVADNSVNENKFIYPFYVRAAIKLVDGSYVKTTSPILMIPNSGCVPNLYYTGNVSGGDYSFLEAAVCADIKYKILSSDFISALKMRKEIVSGISIAVTAPIYTYNMGATASELNEVLYLDSTNTSGSGFTVCELDNFTGDNIHYVDEMNTKKSITPKYRVTLPETKNYKEKMLEASTFYIIKDIELNDLTTDETVVTMDEGTLDGLVARQRLTDNVLSHKAYNADTFYSYNNRLTLGNTKETLYIGYNPSLMAGASYGLDDATYKGGNMLSIITMNIDNVEYKVVNKCTAYDSSRIIWFYYPDENAKSVDIYFNPCDTDGNATEKYYKAHYNLEKHPYLSGAYYLRDLGELKWESIEEDMSAIKYEFETYDSSQTSVINTPNKVLNSVVNNPFVLDMDSVSLIGKGTIQKLISNTRALSQGQFGQHPVLAFCTDGIWALSVGSDGTYTAVQPISRDVCNNVGSITQLDSSVAFTSDKGLLLIDGSQVKQLCKFMDNTDNFDIDVFSDLMSGEFEDYLVKNDDSFIEMLKTCHLVYDYEDNLLWILPEQEIATTTDDEGNETETITEVRQYAVSLVTGEIYGYVNPALYSKSHGGNFTAFYGPSSIISNYPQTYMQMHEIRVASGASGAKVRHDYEVLTTFSCLQEGASVKSKAWLLTRPIAFDDAYSMKMLYDMKVEKMFTSATTDDEKKAAVRVAVYASNDRVNWTIVSSLKARSYKWYRFAIFCNMNDYDRLTGLVCRIDKRRTDKLR